MLGCCCSCGVIILKVVRDGLIRRLLFEQRPKDIKRGDIHIPPERELQVRDTELYLCLVKGSAGSPLWLEQWVKERKKIVFSLRWKRIIFSLRAWGTLFNFSLCLKLDGKTLEGFEQSRCLTWLTSKDHFCCRVRIGEDVSRRRELGSGSCNEPGKRWW